MTHPELPDLLNFLRISDRIGTAGQPTADQFAAIQAAGYDLVVNLAMPDSTNALANEAELVAGQRMDYIHIPVVWDHPRLEDLERFFAVMDDNAGRRVFVHCAMNMRVSVFVLLYRVIRLGLPFDTAREMMLRIWQPDAIWQQFIDDALAHFGAALTPEEGQG
jgi:protein tyrosine phosphatase (PTP) superfamily phosphohydrolase (DUF442 family)